MKLKNKNIISKYLLRYIYLKTVIKQHYYLNKTFEL
jgi:hypothetical protein